MKGRVLRSSSRGLQKIPTYHHLQKNYLKLNKIYDFNKFIDDVFYAFRNRINFLVLLEFFILKCSFVNRTLSERFTMAGRRMDDTPPGSITFDRFHRFDTVTFIMLYYSKSSSSSSGSR